MTLLPWNWLKMRVCQKKLLWLSTSPSDNMYHHRKCSCWSSWTIPADIVVETWAKNCNKVLESYKNSMKLLPKCNFKCNLQKHHSVYVGLWHTIIKWYLSFITCLCFPLVLTRWYSNHCHLMELFKDKESFKSKVDSNDNWKAAWPRIILEWHLFLRLSWGFVWKMLSFWGKHLNFYPKDVCLCWFSVFFV